MADQAHQGVSGPEDQGPAGLVADPAGVDGDTDQPKVLTASITYSAFILIHAHAHTGGGDDRPRLLRRSRAPPSQPLPAPLFVPFPAFGQTNTFHLRAADGRTYGSEQDAVFYEDAWSGDQREHGGTMPVLK